MSERLPRLDDEHARRIQQLAANDEARPAEPPPNLSPAIIKLAYRVSQLKSGMYGIVLLKRSNEDLEYSVCEQGKVERAR